MQVSRPIAFTPATIAQTAPHVAVLGLAPRRAHAEALRPVRLGLARGGEHRVDVHQFLGLEPGLGVRRLRAIAAILRAAAGLDRQQGAQLHLARRVMRAMHLRRAEHELGERQVEQLRDLGAGPVGAGHWSGHPVIREEKVRFMIFQAPLSRTRSKWSKPQLLTLPPTRTTNGSPDHRDVTVDLDRRVADPLLKAHRPASGARRTESSSAGEDRCR